MSNPSKIIHTVPQVGKTKPVLKMKEVFALNDVIDGWTPEMDLPLEDTIMLTYVDPAELSEITEVDVMSFDDAVALSEA